MASKPSKEDDVTDSTDWIATPLSKLSSVDSGLRCQVCKEFFRTPMITSCSHTFCSICIRRCLNNDGQCPACRAKDQELKLRSNWAVEELVEAFTSARPHVLEFATRQADPKSPKRKREITKEAAEGRPLTKRPRSSGRVTRSSQVTVLDSEGELDNEDDDYIPEDNPPNDGLVKCPICQDRMTLKAVEAHIDDCTGEPLSKRRAAAHNQRTLSSLSIPQSNSIKRPEKLPHPHFNGLKDLQLRKKLTDLGLSAAGSRQAQEKRYAEWVLLWNSNCDSKNPRGKGDLRKDLDTWERTQGERASRSNIAFSTGAQIKDKDFDKEAWGNQNSDSYKELIAQARAKVAAKQAESTASDGAQQRTSLTSLPASSLIQSPQNRSVPSRESAEPPPKPDIMSRDTLSRHTSPTKFNSSQPRFFQAYSAVDSSIAPPQSQSQGSVQREDNSGVSSEISRTTSLQP